MNDLPIHPMCRTGPIRTGTSSSAPPQRPQGRVRPLAVLVLCSVAIPAIHSLRPPRPDWSALISWRRDASIEVLDAGVVTLRWLALAGLGYLALAGALQLLLSVAPQLHRRPIARYARAITPRWLTVAGVGLITTTVWAPGGAGAAEPDPLRRDDVRLEVVTEAPTTSPARTMLPWAHLLDAAPTTAAPTDTLPDPPRLETVAGSGPSDPAAVDPQSSAPPADQLLPADPSQLPPPLVVERGTAVDDGVRRHHVVAPGEHFWSIAERVVAERALTVPVADYWRLLVEANRDRLVDRDDPSLLHPGHELVLP